VRRVPVIASVTIPDRSGRTLSGQTSRRSTLDRHANLFAVSVNCALGADEMRPHVAELARIAHAGGMCYPNAGLPNEFGGYDDTPGVDGARCSARSREEGLLNLVGGCCGTRPAHIAAIASRGRPSRRLATAVAGPRITRLSGLEPLTITPSRTSR
jgi:5-methyltetrahydrofolate--homocysteine methyltransferase